MRAPMSLETLMALRYVRTQLEALWERLLLSNSDKTEEATGVRMARDIVQRAIDMGMGMGMSRGTDDGPF